MPSLPVYLVVSIDHTVKGEETKSKRNLSTLSRQIKYSGVWDQ